MSCSDVQSHRVRVSGRDWFVTCEVPFRQSPDARWCGQTQGAVDTEEESIITGKYRGYDITYRSCAVFEYTTVIIGVIN